MAVNKVVYGDETLVDLTADTVTPETLAEGVTAHDASGEQIVGTMVANEGGNGGSVEGAVLYTEQTLTYEQKTQARTNIGAGTSDVQIDSNLNISGRAADAKTVGSRLVNIDNTLYTVTAFNYLASTPSLKFNGNIDGLEKITIIQDGTTEQSIVHISDEVPTFTTNQSCLLSMIVLNNPTAQQVVPVTDSDLVLLGEFAFIVPRDNFEQDGVVFPKKGVWTAYVAQQGIPVMYVSGLYIPGYSFAQTGGSPAQSVQSDWEQSDESKPDAILNRPFGVFGNGPIEWNGYNPDSTETVKVSDLTPTLADFANGCIITTTNVSDNISNSVTLPAECIVQEKDGVIAIWSAPPNQGVPTLPVAFVSLDSALADRGVYFMDLGFMFPGSGEYISKLEIPGYTRTVKRLSKEWLPEKLKLYVTDDNGQQLLYKDQECLIPASKEDVPDISDFVIEVCRNGVKLLTFAPIAIDMQQDFAMVLILASNTAVPYYTAEYLG